MDCETEFSKYITKFGWEENIRSIQETDFSWMWVGLLMICCGPNWEVMVSILEPSKVVVSPVQQLLDFASKSPMITIKKKLVAKTASRGLAQSCFKSFQSHLQIG